MSAFTGCARKSVPADLSKDIELTPLEIAQEAYAHGEYYKARTQVQEILNKDPDNTAAQQLMADVLDKEIARQKEEVLGQRSESLSDEDDDKPNQEEAKTWIERGRTLLRQKQYDLALFAAEKTFVFDANNREASLLIDDIKEAAIADGKADSLFLSKMYKDEIGERVSKYRSEAQTMMHEQKNEQARFILQKILLLEPEDPEALKLYSELQKKAG